MIPRNHQVLNTAQVLGTGMSYQGRSPIGANSTNERGPQAEAGAEHLQVALTLSSDSSACLGVCINFLFDLNLPRCKLPLHQLILLWTGSFGCLHDTQSKRSFMQWQQMPSAAHLEATGGNGLQQPMTGVKINPGSSKTTIATEINYGNLRNLDILSYSINFNDILGVVKGSAGQGWKRPRHSKRRSLSQSPTDPLVTAPANRRHSALRGRCGKSGNLNQVVPCQGLSKK